MKPAVTPAYLKENDGCRCILLELERDGSLSAIDRRSWRERLSASISGEGLQNLRLELHRFYALG